MFPLHLRLVNTCFKGNIGAYRIVDPHTTNFKVSFHTSKLRGEVLEARKTTEPPPPPTEESEKCSLSNPQTLLLCSAQQFILQHF
jgi:hypothetical protein